MCSVSGARCCALPDELIPKGKPASSFYRHKEGQCTCTGNRRSRRLLPESRGCSGRALWKVHCGAWCLAWPSPWASSLALRRSRRRPCSSSERRGRCCRGYRPPDVTWRRSEGPAGQGLVPVKAEPLPRVVPMPSEGSGEASPRKRRLKSDTISVPGG